MSVPVATANPPGAPSSPLAIDFYQLTVSQYEQMGEAGILSEDDKVELIAGYLVHKMTKHEPQTYACERARTRFPG